MFSSFRFCENSDSFIASTIGPPDRYKIARGRSDFGAVTAA
jgi:hypothetical protein